MNSSVIHYQSSHRNLKLIFLVKISQEDTKSKLTVLVEVLKVMLEKMEKKMFLSQMERKNMIPNMKTGTVKILERKICEKDWKETENRGRVKI